MSSIFKILLFTIIFLIIILNAFVYLNPPQEIASYIFGYILSAPKPIPRLVLSTIVVKPR